MDIKRWLEEHPAPPGRARGVEISYSQVRAYLECPWLWKIVYKDRKRAPLHPKSSLGLSIHKALEAFHREDASSWERLLELYDEHWLRAGFATPQEAFEWHRKGGKILEAYWRQELDRRSEIVMVEREFLFELAPHVVRGTIDRLERLPDGAYEIVDYKTHSDVETEEAVSENLQLAVYGLGARECLGVEPAWVSLYYVALGRKVRVPYDPSREEEVGALLRRVADLISRARAFTPRLEHCPACDFRRTCPHSSARS